MDDHIFQAEIVEDSLPENLPSASPQKPTFAFGPLLLQAILWCAGISLVMYVDLTRIAIVSPLGMIYLRTDKVHTYILISRLIFGPILGFSVAYSGIVLYRFARSQPGLPSEGGHWILLQSAGWVVASAFACFSTRLDLRLVAAPPDSPQDSARLVPYLATGLISAAACFFSSTTRWRVFFGLNTAMSGLLVLQILRLFAPLEVREAQDDSGGLFLGMLAIQTMLSISMGVTLAVCALRDTTPPFRKDWFHFAGVFIWCIFILIVILDSIALDFAMS